MLTKLYSGEPQAYCNRHHQFNFGAFNSIEFSHILSFKLIFILLFLSAKIFKLIFYSVNGTISLFEFNSYEGQQSKSRVKRGGPFLKKRIRTTDLV